MQDARRAEGVPALWGCVARAEGLAAVSQTTVKLINR
mgnify:CR=1 FL=1